MCIAVKADGFKVRFRGISSRDECFTHAVYGTFNTKMMQRDADRGAQHITLRSAFLVPPLTSILAVRDIDEQRVLEMSQEDMDRPAMMFALKDGTHCMVDGNHRMAKRVGLGLKSMPFWEFTHGSMIRYRVQVDIEDGKRWKPLPPARALGMVWGKYTDTAGVIR